MTQPRHAVGVSMSRLIVSALALFAASPAFAGGFGLVFTGGANTDQVFYYDQADNMAQHQQDQLLPLMGAGVEFVLGDKDDRIEGVFRGYWQRDMPEKDPAAHAEIAPGDVVSAIREEPRDIGVGTFG